MAKEIAVVLRRAAELIAEPEKWCQGAYRFQGRHCAVGAIITASLEDGRPPDISRAAKEALLRQVGFQPETWQDRVDRTHAEVLAALRAAADAEERNG